MNIKIHKNYKSENYDNRPKKTKIKYIIIHYTETPSFEEAIKLLTSKTRKVSSHYLIDLSGKIYSLVNDSKRAWHAGISFWEDQENLNDNSIGIELVNKGEAKKQKYPNKQIVSLLKILIFLTEKYQIKNFNILGHSDIAPERKIDPGIFFPWKLLFENSFGLWVELKKNQSKFSHNLNNNDGKKFLNNLKVIGYHLKKNNLDKVVNAFHRHYLPENLNSAPSYKSLYISEALKKLKQ